MIFNRKFAPQRPAPSARPPAGPLPKALTDGTPFDYIVVGAGSAGCALVARLLSGLSDVTILLMEAGSSNDVPQIHDFTQAMSLRGTVYDWNDKSQPQNCMDGETVPYDSGYVLGGGSSINGMVWVRGNPGDYDQWASAGCAGWDYQSVLPVFERQENYSGKGAGTTRGTSGPVQVTNAVSMNPISEDFAEAMIGAGYPFNPDYNAGSQEGVTFSQLNVALAPAPVYGIRQDAFTAFVAPEMSNPQLTVVTDVEVQGISFDAQLNAEQVWYSWGGQTYSVPVGREVIICAGTLRTPQILMRSGIGDPAQLEPLGIPVVHAQPAVGQNLQDQLIPFVVWNMARTDPGHFSVMDNNVFVGDSGPGGAPTFELQTFYMQNNPGFPPNSFGLGAIVLHPQTRGQVSLGSGDPSVPPLIQPNLLCDPDDVNVSLAGLKLAREMANEFAAATTWLAGEIQPGPGVVTDQELIDYMKQAAVPDFHFVGTCKMGVDDASVVDPMCRVYGVNGLRVADASIMPFVTSGNTNAPAMMIGGRCGDFIVGG